MKTRFIAIACATLGCALTLAQQPGAPDRLRPAAGPKTSGDFNSDLEVISDAQQQVLSQARELLDGGQERDRAALEAAVKEMERAHKLLEEARKSPNKLPE